MLKGAHRILKLRLRDDSVEMYADAIFTVKGNDYVVIRNGRVLREFGFAAARSIGYVNSHTTEW